MNIEDIRCFISLAECLNFTKSAAQEHITQAAMSRKIARLENELNVKLFYRDKHQVTLTPAGQEFYYQSRKLITSYRDSVNLVKNIHNGFVNKLRIGVGIYEHALLSSFLGDQYPLGSEIKFHCFQYRYRQLMQLFNQNMLDVIISSDQFFSELQPGQVNTYLVSNTDWKVAVNKNNPLAEQKILSSEHLKNATLLTMYEGSMSEVIPYYQPMFTFHEIIQVNSTETKLLMINANAGIGFIPAFISIDQYHSIIEKELVIPYRPRRFYIVCRKNDPHPYVNHFVNAFAEYRKSYLV
ncbi:DNA-binding transcriptional LysR family regulator [Fusobacterium naviforme]|nr:LysR family transcriptional regulator [Fusobacterium naviforme]PSL10148.1 DNA-binding transcriptional LysR family regulator [Fusobacterium naviforme]STO27557.1 Cyn operon transcriptional activator [Fusobacterium naviforme]